MLNSHKMTVMVTDCRCAPLNIEAKIRSESTTVTLKKVLQEIRLEYGVYISTQRRLKEAVMFGVKSRRN